MPGLSGGLFQGNREQYLMCIPFFVKCSHDKSGLGDYILAGEPYNSLHQPSKALCMAHSIRPET